MYYSESSILNRILSFLDGQSAALPVLRTDLETIITFSSALDEMYTAVRISLNNINMKLKTKKENFLRNVEDVHGKLESEMASLRSKKTAWEMEKAKFENIHTFPSTVKLNVGGHKHCVLLSTLRKYPDTMLGAMFSGRHTLIPDTDGSYYIDRDGTHFRYILNLLRSPDTFKVALALPPDVREELKCECDYYGLNDLMFPFAKLSPFVSHDSSFQKVEITQNEDGLFCTKGIPLEICKWCGSADYSNTDERIEEQLPFDACIPEFTSFIEKKGGKIARSQPVLIGYCSYCKQPGFNRNQVK